ncbi:hypothetical protein ACWGB8_01875 [Kitasatospora sp. NPDC054939]
MDTKPCGVCRNPNARLYAAGWLCDPHNPANTGIARIPTTHPHYRPPAEPANEED